MRCLMVNTLLGETDRVVSLPCMQQALQACIILHILVFFTCR